MKGFLVIAAVLLVGCAPAKTLEELEFAALASGDWSAVEKREQNIERRKRQRSVSCGSDYVPVCTERARERSASAGRSRILRNGCVPCNGPRDHRVSMAIISTSRG